MFSGQSVYVLRPLHLTYVAALLFLASVRCYGADPVELDPPLPKLLQKLHDFI
jgi:hypothetical protein